MRLSVCKIALFLCILIIGMDLPGKAQARTIEVDLVWHFAQAGWTEVNIVGGSYRMRHGQMERNLTIGSILQVGWGGWAPVWRIGYETFNILREPLMVLPNGTDACFSIRMPDGQSYEYRGGLKISWVGNRWQIVNTVEEEDYLKGVVPIEMSNSWARDGLEALKAQAVAARTFMEKHSQGGRLLTDSPDIDQAYAGKNVEGAASKAVEATYSQILVDTVSRQPIDAFYSAHNGGQSEDAVNVWGNRDSHYLARPDEFSRGVGGAEDHWRYIIAATFLGSRFDMGPVRQVILDQYSSGRVKEVTLVDIDGNRKLVPGRKFVKTFYPFGKPISKNSFLGSLYSVEYIATSSQKDYLWNAGSMPLIRLGRNFSEAVGSVRGGPRLDRIISSDQGISESGQPFGVFIFDGHGWGHGVGMSQWGAYHMAQLGYSYREILNYYYVNTELKYNGSTLSE